MTGSPKARRFPPDAGQYLLPAAPLPVGLGASFFGAGFAAASAARNSSGLMATLFAMRLRFTSLYGMVHIAPVAGSTITRPIRPPARMFPKYHGFRFAFSGTSDA